jgi:molecular chaperone DnaK
MSHTITIGIDLGTTNSAIAIHNNGKYEIVKNPEWMEYTPSVFWYNKGWNMQIGQKAFKQLFDLSDDESFANYSAEIKRLMWTTEKIEFPRGKVTMSAEEISAEILKSLKESVIKKYPDFYVGWVVITVPAYFDTIQKEATKLAGELAGFEYTVLLQEPIAAAVAYWFENKINENWLVYDLGGGTFDVAIISSQDGVLTIKWHGWDNFLWGKDFDEAIVDTFIVPELKSKFDFDSLDRGNTDSKPLYNRLKSLAESAKKELSDASKIQIVIEDIQDESGQDVFLEIPLSREKFESIIEKMVDSSLQICKDAVRESGLSSSDISRIILVWGSTQSPYIRKRLEQDLKIKVDASVDPLTVVAKWACIFGGSQVIPESAKKIKKSEKVWSVELQLNYEAMTSETDTMVTGSVIGNDANSELSIQIQSEDGLYSGNKIKLKNGKFYDTVVIGENKTNTYFIYLTDAEWNIIPTNPEMFHITHWLSIAGTPITHSVGISLNKKTLMSNQAEEYMDIVFPRGSILPLKKTLTYRTSRSLKKWDKENTLPIKIYEGESEKSDRNTQICGVIVSGEDIPYNLPEGTEVNITVELDISGEVKISAYFPSIDLHKSWKSLRTTGDQEVYTPEILQKKIQKEKKRVLELNEHISSDKKNEMETEMDHLDNQASSTDTDTLRKTHQKIKELQNTIDALEKSTEWDKTKNEYKEALDRAQENYKLSEHPLEYKQVQALKEAGDVALAWWNIGKLKTVTEELAAMNVQNLVNSSDWMKALLGHLYNERHKSTDPVRSAEIFERSVPYIESNNVEWMKQCFFELRELMPSDVQESMGNVSGITK